MQDQSTTQAVEEQLHSLTAGVYAGRGLLDHQDSNGQGSSWPALAEESMRTIAHLTRTKWIPAPVAYEVLEALKQAGWCIPQTLDQLAKGLSGSLNVEGLTVTQDDGTDPALHTAEAVELLEHAQDLAQQLSEALAQAQFSISGQSYKVTKSKVEEGR